MQIGSGLAGGSRSRIERDYMPSYLCVAANSDEAQLSVAVLTQEATKCPLGWARVSGPIACDTAVAVRERGR